MPLIGARLENLRAMSLRADFSREPTQNDSLKEHTARSSSSFKDHKAVHWEDPSEKDDDEAKQKVRKEVEAWAAVDLAAIDAFS